MTHCEICGTDLPKPKTEKDKKKRCQRCSERYDANGVAYVVYCDFYRFEKVMGRDNTPTCITFWVHDGKVQRAPKQFQKLVGRKDEAAVAIMCRLGYGLEIWKAQVH